MSAPTQTQAPHPDEVLEKDQVGLAVLEYVIYRKLDNTKSRHICYPVLKNYAFIIRPEYAKKRVVHENEWDSNSDSSTSHKRIESMTEIRLADGEWLAVRTLEAWATWSNAAYLNGRLVPACETGEAVLKVEIGKIDREYWEEYEKYLEDGDYDEPYPDTLEEYLRYLFESLVREDPAALDAIKVRVIEGIVPITAVIEALEREGIMHQVIETPFYTEAYEKARENGYSAVIAEEGKAVVVPLTRNEIERVIDEAMTAQW